MRNDRFKKLMVEAMAGALSNEQAPFPAGGAYLWQWFNDLCRTRTGNGNGPNPISYAEIEAYARLYRCPLQPHHVDLLLAMDRVWLDYAYEGVQRQRGSGGRGQGKSMTLDPAGFDAVFG